MGEELREAIGFVQRFPLFFSSGRAKYARTLHQAYFPTPMPMSFSSMPYRGLCYLNALPVLHLFRGTGFLAPCNAAEDLRLLTTKSDQMIAPSTKEFFACASSGFTQRFAQHIKAYRSPILFMNQPWHSLSDDEKRLAVTCITNTPLGFLLKECPLYLNDDTLEVSDSPIPDALMIPGAVQPGPVYDERLRQRDYRPCAEDPFWDYGGVYEWHTYRKNHTNEMSARIAATIRRRTGSPWQVLTILFDEPVIEEGHFFYRPLYAADPYSVILYAMRHGAVPPNVLDDDYQLDDRILTFQSWDTYEASRRQILAAINPRLNLIMETLYANKPLSSLPRVHRRRSGHASRMYQLYKKR